MAHEQKHSILGADHLPGTTPLAGKYSIIGTNDQSQLGELIVEAPNQGAPVGGEVVRRQMTGHINLPTSNATGTQAISAAQAQTLLSGGMYRGAVDDVGPDRTSPEITGLKLGSLFIETGGPSSTEAIWKVTGIGGGTTGALVDWTNQGVPDSDVIYVNRKTGGQWMYSVDQGEWIDLGTSGHNRLHDIEDPSDHSVQLNHYGLVFTTNGGVNVLPMVASDTGYPNVPKGAPVLANGLGQPIYGALLLADAVYQGSQVIPTTIDVSTWSDNTVGVVRTTAGRFWVFKETAAQAYAVEMGKV